jgi:ABC-type amino acid transport substrate-binding protein
MRALVILSCVATLACAGEQEKSSAPPPAPKEIPPSPGRSVAAVAPQARLVDWDGILNSGTLRIGVVDHGNKDDRITRRSLDAGIAFEQALNAKFAPQAVKVVFYGVIESQIVYAVQKGLVDVGTNVRLTFERDEQVAFATPILTGVRELIALSPSEPPLVSLEDIGNRSIVVPYGSDHLASMQRLNEQLRKIDRPPAKVIVSKLESSGSLVAKVDRGQITGTVIDDFLYEALKPGLPNARINRDIAVSQDGVIAWVTRKDAPRLLALINEFFSTHTLTF